MPNAKLLNRISITSPCSQSWDEMSGNDQVRFCSHCNLSVQDISLMTRFEAERLVLRSKGRLCLRIHRTPAGEIITRPVQNLYSISRRASRIAAGTFTALISMSAATYAQSSSAGLTDLARPVEQGSSQPKSSGIFTSLVGVALDPNDAAVPGAEVTLTNKHTHQVEVTQTDDEGRYRFWVDAADSYSITIELPGFVKHMTELSSLATDRETLVTSVLMLDGMSVTVGGGSISYEKPLLKAVSENDLDQVLELLRDGEDVNQTEDGSTTALKLAVGRVEFDITRQLLNAGAEVEFGGEDGRTALFWLPDERGPEMIALLISSGARIDRSDNEGHTPLINAASYGGASLIQALIDAGANVNAQNHDGNTALMAAAEAGNEDAVKILLAAGAVYDWRNSDGKDALMLAQEHENEEIVDLLLAAGAVETVRTPANEAPNVDCRIPLSPSTPEPTREGED